MAELTLEALAKRIEAIEKELAERRQVGIPPKKHWWQVGGKAEDDEFTRAMLAEMQARRDADRGDDPEGEPT